MWRIEGLPDEQRMAYEDRIEAVIAAQLQMVMDRIADRIAAIQVASARVPVLALVAADPPDDGLPPGQPYVSPDDLAAVTPLWQEAVASSVLPIVAETFQAAAGATYAQMVDALDAAVPSFGSLAAETYLAQAQNTFNEIADDLWATARSELLEGFEQGESIPQLAERLRESAGMTARTATLVGRTQVIEASNAGSIATARAAGFGPLKFWMDTPDRRTRETHRIAAEVYNERDGAIPLHEPFIVGGFPADFPAAPSLPPAERYSCRCALGFVVTDEMADLVRANAGPSPQSQPPGTSGTPLVTAPEGMVLAPGATSIDRTLSAVPGPDVADLSDFVAAPAVVRPVLRAAKTPLQLKAAWKGEMQRITGRDIYLDMGPDPSLKTMSEYAEGVLQGFERFPEAKIGGISWFDAPGGDYARVEAGATWGGVKSASMQFNAAWAAKDSRAKLLRALRGDQSGWEKPGRDGWSTRGASSPMSTAFHEFAHVLDLENTAGRAVPQVRAAIARAAAREGIDDDTLVGRDISIYASSDTRETIAEAFTDVMVRGPQASAISREIYDIVAAEYRRGGFNLRLAPVVDELGDEGRVFARTPAPLSATAKITSLLRGIPPGAPKQMRVKIKAELERQAALAPRAVDDLIETKIATDAEWRMLFRSEAERLEADKLSAVYVNGRIYFSPRWVSDRDAVERSIRSGFQNDDVAWTFPEFTPRSIDTAAGVLRHEIGHVIARDLPSEASGVPWSRAMVERYLVPLADELGVDAPSGVDVHAWFRTGAVQRAVRSKISPLATQNLEETFAELWAVYSGRGVEASAIARRMGEILGGVRRVDVVAPARLNSMTVAQLRALAKTRGIEVPTGARKADLVRLLGDETPSAPTTLSGTAAHKAALITRRLDAADHEALSEYHGGWAAGMNRALRSGRGVIDPANADALRLARGMDRLMEGQSLSRDIAVERGVIYDELVDMAGGAPRGGMTYIDHGFSSTTTTGRPRLRLGEENAVLHIRVPQGTRAISTRSTGALDELDFGEVVLDRGLTYRIMGESVRDGVRHFDVEIVPVRAAKVAPIANARTPLAELRDLARARGIDTAGVRKTELVRLVNETPELTRPAGSIEFDRAVAAAKKGNAATAQTGYRFSGNANQNADLFPDRAERVKIMDAFAGYRGIGSARINRALRAGTPEADTRIAEMDKAFALSPLRGDVLVYRGARGVPEFGPVGEWGDSLVGRTWTDRAFTSTSVNAEKARPFASDGVMLRIVVPKDTPAVGIRPAARIEAREQEILLDRDMTFRVVADHGSTPPPGMAAAVADSERAAVRRFLDVEVVPGVRRPIVVKVAPVATSKTPLVELRDLAKARGIDTAGVRKAELVRLVNETPELDANQIKRAAARARHAQIAQGEGTAKLLAEIDELLAKGASKAQLRQSLDPALIAPDSLFAGADRAVLDALRDALATGDMAKLKTAITRASTKAKIKVVGGKTGAKAKFDPDTMEGFEGATIQPGVAVTVVRRGSTLTMPDGEVIALEKARVVVTTPAKSAATAKAEAAYAARQDHLRDLARHGTLVEHRNLSGGSIADTTLLTYDDGSRVVFKLSRMSPEQSADAEELAARVMDAVGMRAPAVTRSGNAVSMEYIEGRTATELGFSSGFSSGLSNDRFRRFIDSADGRRLGLADVLLGNMDRNPGNWMITDQMRKLVAIDHGSAFRASDIGDLRGSNPFVQYFFDAADPISRKLLASLPISRRQLAKMRVRLVDLKPEFERLGRIDWYTGMIRRLTEIEGRASLT